MFRALLPNNMSRVSKEVKIAAASGAAICLLAGSAALGAASHEQAMMREAREPMVSCSMPTNLPVGESPDSPYVEAAPNQVTISGTMPVLYETKIVPISQCIVTPKF